MLNQSRCSFQGLFVFLSALSLHACNLDKDYYSSNPSDSPPAGQTIAKQWTFQEDIEFLAAHTDVVVLTDPTSDGRIAVVPQMQGRVMTSSIMGDLGASLGWINRELIASGELRAHINAFGGEDRFWLGPEGGQFSIFFKSGEPFDLKSWQTPALIDADAYELVSRSENTVIFRHSGSVANYSGVRFQLQIDRVVRLLPERMVRNWLGISENDDISVVGFESDNRLTNIGEHQWSKETGLLSIWILGMFNPSADAVVAIPISNGENTEDAINDRYFGRPSSERLKLIDDVALFRADGRCRGKIGVRSTHAMGALGAYDPELEVLTIVQYSQDDNSAAYVNSLWEIQDEPYGGDVINAYNDGPPPEGGDQLGPFYELETSSPALRLSPGEGASHVHRTIHLSGNIRDLGAVAERILNVSLGEIDEAFGLNGEGCD